MSQGSSSDVVLRMPDLATTGSPVKVVRWLVEVGQFVRRGQPLLEVETDKAAMEVESIATGTLSAVHVQPDVEVTAGQTIAVIAAETPGASTTPAPTALASSETTGAASKKGLGMFAKHRAENRSPDGAAPNQPVPLSPTQRVVARRMQESKQTVPHFYLQTSADAEPMRARRLAAAPSKTAWDAFFVHAVGKALRQFPRMRLRFEADRYTSAEADSVGLAVDHAGDLYVITLAAPADKTPEQLSQEIRAGVEALRSGVPEARRPAAADITVTNLGAENVEAFAAIVNPPEAAILAVGRIAPVATVTGDAVVAQLRVTLTLSVDHRVVNGRYAAGFLGAVVRELETL